MNGSVPTPSNVPEEVAARYSAKVHAELEAADRIAPGIDVVSSAGDPFAAVMLVKGDPGPAEVAGGAALSGPDGEAAGKALEALGFDVSAVFGTVARPERSIDPALCAKRLRLQIEAVDPQYVIALDEVASELLTTAYGLDKVRTGRPVEAAGRTLLAVAGLEASLSDESAKRRVWRQFRTLTPRRPTL